MIQLSIISVLLSLELMFVLLVAAIVFWFKFQHEKNNNKETIGVEDVGLESSEVSGSSETSLELPYEDCLRSELKQLQDMTSNIAEDATEEHRLLKHRQDFLSFELLAQDWLLEEETYQGKLMDGIRDLITQSASEDESNEAEDVDNKAYEEQLTYFKAVIDNQLNVMREMREKLSATEGDNEVSEDMQAMIDQLQRAETQAQELTRCVDVLEGENKRLHKMGGTVNDDVAEKEHHEVLEDINGMEDLVSNQQQTIIKLKGLLDHLSLEAEKAEELETLIGAMQHANTELTGCVTVLEDENTMLRDEMERLRGNLSIMLAAKKVAVKSEPDTDGAELEKLVKKLENIRGMIDIKDTTIGELQQKIQALESEYMTATGKMPVIPEEIFENPEEEKEEGEQNGNDEKEISKEA